MKIPNNQKEPHYVLIPHDRLEAIEKRQDQILEILQSKPRTSSEALNYVGEKEAKKLIGKKTTWFWLMRKSGRLKYTKVGSKVYYSVEELNKLILEGGRI